MQRLSYPAETVLYNKITRDRIVLSFKDGPRQPLRRRPKESHRRVGKPRSRKLSLAARAAVVKHNG